MRRGLVYGCACGAAAVGQLGGSAPLDARAVDAAMSREHREAAAERLDFTKGPGSFRSPEG